MKAQIVVVLFEPNPPELELDWQVYCSRKMLFKLEQQQQQ